ncbi:hypothetical protein H4R33_003791 [Dimargaris cristalligena]|uniref:Roadblock/LAMTOR2 domain-containing protein n=1 Tax=Dimargaris cristalligena TaxID=215637 RepID=A0A4P9ZSH4_9FUNG|nr:hypothetical protein H4R33_003791 [Dimargaris cristalligena]RKP36433.1 hypothetical protein BJ085DRAFT_31344 [Dimargaris cristalligena]|eukprot:RKP36433.1 hypothetical protein BJ085DRAFT_31344 [Dimargaris cristalligena]
MASDPLFTPIFEDHPGLQAILLTDPDGILISFKQRPGRPTTTASASGGPIACDPTLTTQLVQAVDKLKRLGMETMKATVCVGERFQYIYFSFSSVQCVLLADLDAHMGQLLTLRPRLEEGLKPVINKVSTIAGTVMLNPRMANLGYDGY